MTNPRARLCLWKWNILKSKSGHIWETSKPIPWVSLLFQKKSWIKWVELDSRVYTGRYKILRAWFSRHKDLVQIIAASFSHYMILEKPPLLSSLFSLLWDRGKLTGWQRAQASPRPGDTWESKGSWQIKETSPVAISKGLGLGVGNGNPEQKTEL